MSRKETLNEHKGNQISDLEALFIVMNKLMDDKIEEKPNAGITIAKDRKNERRIRYTKAKRLLLHLEHYLGQKGCFSIGVCETCTSFDCAGHGNRAFGTCHKNGDYKHRWDTCTSHSKDGGGYGA